MKCWIALCFASLLLLTSACQPSAPVCPPGSITYVTNSTPFPTLSSPVDAEPSLAPVQVEVNGKVKQVDKVIRGSLCEGTWSGTIYVACDVHVAEWEDDPTFLQNCNLTIEPGTVVYVAAHNDAPYYKGCSCHTGEEPIE